MWLWLSVIAGSVAVSAILAYAYRENQLAKNTSEILYGDDDRL